MELQFEKIGKKWVAEFEATGNFNLNIERVAPEKIQVFQKGAEDGEYASQASWYNNYASAIVDYDFSALIYPKWIKVVSYSEPIQAIVTMEGESGGSGTGGGLRPITAEDVQLKVFNDNMGEEMTLEFATEFNVNVYNGKLRIYSDKPLFIGQGTDKPFLYNATESRWECQSYPSYSGMNVVLDIYTQD